jgi:hypothetical protein
MAVEETEYFSPTVGNGVMVERKREAPATGRSARGTHATVSAPANRLMPFVQGITLGAVLMIPFGVWWWAQSPAVAATDPGTSAQAVTAKGKQSKALPKKKAYRAGAVPPAVKNQPKADSGSKAVAAPDQSFEAPPPISVDVPLAAPKAIAVEIPAPNPVVEPATSGKKGLVRTLVTPFQRPKPKIIGIDQ